MTTNVDISDGDLLVIPRAEVERLRAEVARLSADNARLAPRQRAGQRIFNAVYALDPAFADSVRATDVDPFHDDKLCESFLYAWTTRMKDRRDAGEPFIPDPRCASCGQGVSCQESCCAGPGPDGVLCHNECVEVLK